MSEYPPPVPQKVKPKPCSSLPLLSNLIESTSESSAMIHKSGIDICNPLLYPKMLSQSSIHHFTNQCSNLKDQDQQLMQLFMCIREEILVLQEPGNLYRYNPGVPHPNVQSLYNQSDKGSKIRSQHSIESVIKSYQVVKEPAQEFLHFDIISHFETSKIYMVLDEFKKYTDSNGLRIMSTICSTKERAIFDDTSNHHTLLPPVPEKKARRDLLHECTLPHNSLNFNDDISHSQSLVCDPVLAQGCPRSKSFNSNAFLNHARKSSMTLSDFYDHLNPVSIGENFKNNTCEQSTFSTSYRLPSHMSNTHFTHKQAIFPTSKSNVDCKFSGLGSSPHSEQSRHEVFPTELKNFCELNVFPGSNEDKESQLIRAGSSPILSSLSTLPKFHVSEKTEDPANISGSTQNAKEMNSPENLKFQPVVSKSPKKLFSIISRGISSGFNKHNGKRNQKYSQSSGDLTNSFVQNTNLMLIENVSTKANLNIQKGVSLLSPLSEIPPPIPPKYNKQNTEKSVDLQQTWC